MGSLEHIKEAVGRVMEKYDISTHKFECSRIHNDSFVDDDCVFIATPYATGFLSRNDVIAMAKFYNITSGDLNIDVIDDANNE